MSSGTFLYTLKSGIYLNCGVLGALLIPLKPQRCSKVQSETVRLLEQNDTEAPMFEKSPKEVEFNTIHNLKVSEQGKAGRRASGGNIYRKYFSNFSKLFKFSLFRSPTFVVICVSSFFQSFGWLVPFMYLAGNLIYLLHKNIATNNNYCVVELAHAVNMGIPKEEASFLLSIVGICNMMGRIVNGWLSDHPKVYIFNFVLTEVKSFREKYFLYIYRSACSFSIISACQSPVC